MRIRRFGHAGIEVGDLAAAEAFYRRLFGFEVAARYPEDGEVMLSVGQHDHLLLHAGRAEQVGDGASGGLHHVAFELVEGHRELAVVRDRLDAHGIVFDVADHAGDASVYFRDLDGNLLELYAARSSTPHFASAGERHEAARRFIHGHARAVDRALFDHVHGAAPVTRVLAAVEAYANSDGGFGHALEPDVRAPGSQPIHTLTALELLREARVASPAIADRCCEFFESVATVEGAMPALLAGALDHPAAAHWQGPFATEPRWGWTFGAIAELIWHGARHPWFHRTSAACLEKIEELESEEAHELLYLVRFAERALKGHRRGRELTRRCDALRHAAWCVTEVPVRRYGLTPLHYAPAPDAPGRVAFDDALIDAHLDDLLDAQQGDGGWPIRFEPPTEAAYWEWRGRCTLEALGVLRAYGRLP